MENQASMDNSITVCKRNWATNMRLEIIDATEVKQPRKIVGRIKMDKIRINRNEIIKVLSLIGMCM